MQLLLIEVDELVAFGLVAGLELDGFVVDHVSNGRQASHAMSLFTPDALILDLGLPDADGMAMLRQWRSEGLNAPVLILTARDALNDRVTGLEAGGDDYVLKPFELDELVARLRALVRRAAGRSVSEIVHGDLIVRPSEGEVRLCDQPVRLSRRELTLLEKFLNARGAVLTEDQLKDSLYGMTTNVESNVLNVHIYHLRKKLGRELIETVRGVGYRLGPPLSVSDQAAS